MKYAIFLVVFMTLWLGGCTLLGQQKPTTSTDQGVKPTDSKSTSENKIPSNKLNLSNQQLKKIPEYVFKQTNLEELDVANNQLTGAIQAEIRHLQNLKVLKANNNNMTGVPAEIGQLQNLEILDLSNNELTGLPYELGNLKKIKILNISGNNYSTLDLNIIKE